jgi:hypothetical protein
MVPAPMASARGNGSARRPIMALAPAVGDVDLLVASELMEAGRAVAGGYTAPDRTMAIASTSRSYLVVEKIAMSDGRYDPQFLIAAVEKNSRQALLLDSISRHSRGKPMCHDQRGAARRDCRRARPAHYGGGIRSGDPR